MFESIWRFPWTCPEFYWQRVATRGQQRSKLPSKPFFFLFLNPLKQSISAQCLQRWVCSTARLSALSLLSPCVFLWKEKGSSVDRVPHFVSNTDWHTFKYVNLSLYMAFYFAPCRISLPFYSPFKKKKYLTNYTVLCKSMLTDI